MGCRGSPREQGGLPRGPAPPPAKCAPRWDAGGGRGGEHQLAHLGGSRRRGWSGSYRRAAGGGRSCLPAAAAAASPGPARSRAGRVSTTRPSAAPRKIHYSQRVCCGGFFFPPFSPFLFIFSFFFFLRAPKAPGRGVRFKWELSGSPGALKPHSFSHPSQNLFTSVPSLQFA